MHKFERIIGLILCVLGGLVLAGWWFHLPLLVQLLPGSTAMVPNTALCFVLTGAGMLVWSESVAGTRYWRFGFVGVVSLIAAVTLLQYVWDLDFGTDRWIAPIWIEDSNPYPGRMAPQTAVSFLGSSLVFVLLTTRVRLFTDAAIHTLLIVIGAVGIIGVAGYALGVGLLYSWYQYTAIAVHTGIGFVLLVIGLWTAWLRWRSVNVDPDVQGIGGVIAITFVMAAILITGLFSFVALTARTEMLLRTHFEGALHSQIRAVRAEIQASSEYTESVTHRPVTLQNVRMLNADSTNQMARQFLKTTVEALVRQNLSAVAFHGLSGALYGSAGMFEQKPLFEAALGADIHLMWKDGFLLRRRLPLLIDTQPIGFAVVEMRVPRLQDVFSDVFYFGKTAEAGMCAPAGAEAMQCVPTRFRNTAFKTARVVQRQPLPLARALDGEAGFARIRDYRRQEVFAAYSPIEPYALGMVVKIDSAEFNTPVREQFQKVIGLTSIFIVGIAWVLRRHRYRRGEK